MALPALGWNAKLFTFTAEDGGGITYGRSVTPFVNMNHLATAMNFGWPIALGARCCRLRRSEEAARVRAGYPRETAAVLCCSLS